MSSPATQRVQAVAPASASEGIPSGDLQHEAIERLAYSHWMARGCPCGSPEVDWFQAEEELQGAGKAPAKDIVDEASDESFPASDAPAY